MTKDLSQLDKLIYGLGAQLELQELDNTQRQQLFEKTVAAIKSLMLDVIGEDEPMKTKRSDKWASSAPYKRNQLRAELRERISKL